MKLYDSYMNETENIFDIKKDYVIDKNTGLYWEIKSYDKAALNSGENQYTFSQACNEYLKSLNDNSYGGFSDWRIPNMDELRTIVDYARKENVFDTKIFGNCQVGDYWSSNVFIPQPEMSWVIFSGFGSAIAKVRDSERYVIAVRGGNDTRFGTDDTSRFTDNGDGTVTDLSTGLMWQQGENQRADITEAEKICSKMTLAGYTDWRLPTIKEINTIQDLSYKNGSWFFDDFFKAEGVSGMLHYRASTMFYNHYSWVTNFSKGYDGYYAGTDAPLLFRAVRTIDSTEKMRSAYIKSDENDYLYSGSDGIITDEKTGYVWNEKYAKNSCSFEEAKEFLKKANQTELDGYSDWRLPLREELRSIMCYDGRIPAVEGDSFKNIAPGFVWTAQENKNDNSLAWAFYMGYGCCVVMRKEEFGGVILVRGNKSSYEMKSDERFIINNDGTVTDKITSLMWMKDETPMLTIEEAKEYCKNMNLGGYNDWYLPSMKELGTIVNITEGEKWFFESVFPETNIYPQGFYMTSDIFDKSFGWGCNFQFGFDGYYADKTEGKYPFRPVRKIGENG